MPTAEDVFARETILAGIHAAGGSLPEMDVLPAVERRLHADLFPRGSEGRIERIAADLEARGVIARADGRVSIDYEHPAHHAFLADWFDALGGLTHVDGPLHRSPLPFTRAHFDALHAAGVTVVFSLEENVPADLARAAGLDWRPHFWEDNGKPTFEELDSFLAQVHALPASGRVVAHCKAGLGRTGIALASAIAMMRGVSADDALALYWSKVPLAREIMTRYGQAEFVRRYVAARA